MDNLQFGNCTKNLKSTSIKYFKCTRKYPKFQQNTKKLVEKLIVFY